MDTLGDLLATGDDDAIALATSSRAGSYSYGKLRTSAWKAGNLLRHYGVRPTSRVAIAADGAVTPPPLVGFFGAALAGGEVRFDPPTEVTATVLLAPTATVDDYDPQPGCKLLGYGDRSDDPTVAHFEREAWSENPTEPPVSVGRDATVLVTDHSVYSHGDLLGRARAVAHERGYEADDVIELTGSLGTPATLAGQVLAPLSAGATVRLAGSE
jgi:hypothetical protein